MLTIQQTAIEVGRRIGLPPSFDGSTLAINSLDPDQEISLTSGIGAAIRANPTEYTPGQVATAQAMSGLSGAPLADAGFSIGDFVEAVGQNADNLLLEPLVNVGKSASAVANALPLIGIVVAAYILTQWTKNTAAKV